MSQITKFIDRVTSADQKKQTTIVFTIEDARFLKDEITKLLMNLHDIEREVAEPKIEVMVTGGKFK